MPYSGPLMKMLESRRSHSRGTPVWGSSESGSDPLVAQEVEDGTVVRQRAERKREPLPGSLDLRPGRVEQVVGQAMDAGVEDRAAPGTLSYTYGRPSSVQIRLNPLYVPATRRNLASRADMGVAASSISTTSPPRLGASGLSRGEPR